MSLVSALVPQVAPTIVRVVKAPPTKELSAADLILSGLGLTGLILVAALVVGIVLGVVFIWFKSVHPQNPLNGEASQTHGLHLDRVQASVPSPQEPSR